MLPHIYIHTCIHTYVRLVCTLPHLSHTSSVLSRCSGILLMDRRNVDAIYVRGMCLMKQGNEEKAVDFFRQALQLDPDHHRSRAAIKVSQANLPASQSTKCLYIMCMHPYVYMCMYVRTCVLPLYYLQYSGTAKV